MVVMAEKINLPPGFRFQPTDEELISCYLKPKFLKQTLLYDFIKKQELYGRNCTPWELFDVNDDNSWIQEKPTEKAVYVFTNLSKLRTSESNAVRSRENTSKRAGCGTWAGKTKKLIMDGEGNLIGEKRLLVFEINEIGVRFDPSKAGYFKMHEYSLSGVNKGLDSAGGGDVVLCKITFDSSKEPIFKLGMKSNDHVSESSTSEDQKKEEKIKNLETHVGDTLEGTLNLTTKSVDVMNSSVGDNIEGTECLTTENLVVLDSGMDDYDFLLDNYCATAQECNYDFLLDNCCATAQECNYDFLLDNCCAPAEECNYDFLLDNCCATAQECNVAAQLNNGFQESNELSEDLCFDMDSFISLLTSDQEEGSDDGTTISTLRKRKIELENLLVTKKMCL